MQIYLVGGAVRDELLGIKSNDLDYVMVLDNTSISVEEGFQIMEEYMFRNGFEIFLSTPEMFTIRAKFPKDHPNKGETADFVLARKEVGYIEGTRRPILELGTLEDDLGRRDFTINAMAKDSDGNIIDLFNGISDLKHGILRTPKDSSITMLDDPLRLIRAIRFSITKNFIIHHNIWDIMDNYEIIEKLKLVVSKERIQTEMNKCFKHDTIGTLRFISYLRDEGMSLPDLLIPEGYYLELTNKK